MPLSIVSSQGRWSVSPELLRMPMRSNDQSAPVSSTEGRPSPQAPRADLPGPKVVKLPRRHRAEREFLPAALEIIDTPPSPVGRAVGLGIIAMAVFALVWACIG